MPHERDGMGVAQRRLRPVPSIAQPPAELAEFDLTEWAEIGDRDRAEIGGRPDWGPAFCRWLDGRRAWADKHGPEGFGGWLAYLRAEHQTRSDMYRQGES
jgi:hypothetical protein